MNVNQLKKELKKRSKSTNGKKSILTANGKKSILTERLLACLNVPAVSQEEAMKGKKLAKDLQAFHPNAAWRERVFLESWDLGEVLSGDEQTISFKGNHVDKL